MKKSQNFWLPYKESFKKAILFGIFFRGLLYCISFADDSAEIAHPAYYDNFLFNQILEIVGLLFLVYIVRMLSTGSFWKWSVGLFVGLLLVSVAVLLARLLYDVKMIPAYGTVMTVAPILVYLLFYGRDNFYWLRAKIAGSKRDLDPIDVTIYNQSGMCGTIGILSYELNGKVVEKVEEDYISNISAFKYAEQLAKKFRRQVNLDLQSSIHGKITIMFSAEGEMILS